MDKNLYARWNGGDVFGDAPSFAIAVLTDTPASRDTFLGYPPGTSTEPPFRAFAISGRFYAGTQAAVQASLDGLAALHDLTAPFGYPTGQPFPDDYVWATGFWYWLPSDLVPGAISASAGNAFTATYKLVLRGD